MFINDGVTMLKKLFIVLMCLGLAVPVMAQDFSEEDVDDILATLGFDFEEELPEESATPPEPAAVAIEEEFDAWGDFTDEPAIVEEIVEEEIVSADDDPFAELFAAEGFLDEDPVAVEPAANPVEEPVAMPEPIAEEDNFEDLFADFEEEMAVEEPVAVEAPVIEAEADFDDLDLDSFFDEFEETEVIQTAPVMAEEAVAEVEPIVEEVAAPIVTQEEVFAVTIPEPNREVITPADRELRELPRKPKKDAPSARPIKKDKPAAPPAIKPAVAVPGAAPKVEEEVIVEKKAKKSKKTEKLDRTPLRVPEWNQPAAW